MTEKKLVLAIQISGQSFDRLRNGLMNAHADPFRQIPTIVKALPDPIDQMKIFGLIQIIPSPTKAALASGNWAITVPDPTMMFYLRNNSVFAYGETDRQRTSATFREILDAIWLFDEKFERAMTEFNELKDRRKG